MAPRTVWVLATLLLPATATIPIPFLDYSALPNKTVFPGPWERYIKAPADKSRIVPARIWRVGGNVTTSSTGSLLHDGPYISGSGILIGPGGTITFEFAENIAGLSVNVPTGLFGPCHLALLTSRPVSASPSGLSGTTPRSRLATRNRLSLPAPSQIRQQSW